MQENRAAPPNNLTPSVAVLASPRCINDMVTWICDHVSFLGGTCSLLAPPNLASRLREVQRLSLDSRLLSLRVEEPLLVSDDPDVVIAGKVLAGQVQGVVVFKDFQSNETVPDINLLARVCATRNIPLSLNRATADLALRGVAKTRVVYLIFNPVAGQGDSTADLDLVRSILEPTMILNVVMTEKDRDVADQAREVVEVIRASRKISAEDGSSMQSMIVASGGDGTVSAVAGATMSTGIPFGAIPRGTANAFSVGLGIPTNIEEASRNVLTGHVRVIDGGKCNEIPFINLAGLGFEAGLVNNATRELKNAFGNLAYTLGAAQQCIQQELFTCKIRIDEEEETQTIQTKVITVANVAPPSSVFAQGFGKIIPDDGLFEVTIATGTCAVEEIEGLASLWASSVVQETVPSDHLLRIRAKTITVDCDPPQKLLLDGEVLEANPVTFRVIPNGLSVVTPAPAAAAAKRNKVASITN